MNWSKNTTIKPNGKEKKKKSLEFSIYSKFLFLHSKSFNGTIPKKFIHSRHYSSFNIETRQYYSMVRILLSYGLLSAERNNYRLVSKRKALGRRHKSLFKIDRKKSHNSDSFKIFRDKLFLSLIAEVKRRQEFLIRWKGIHLRSSSNRKLKFYTDSMTPKNITDRNSKKISKYYNEHPNVKQETTPVIITQRMLAKKLKMPQQTVSNYYKRLKKDGLIRYTEIKRRLKYQIPDYLFNNGRFQSMYVFNIGGSTIAHFGCEIMVTPKGMRVFKNPDLIENLKKGWKKTHNKFNNGWLSFGSDKSSTNKLGNRLTHFCNGINNQ